MPLKLNSTGGGSVTVDVPNTASTYTATLPAVTGNIITTGDSGTVTPTMLSQKMTSGTAITLTNQTAPEFTGIPSWVKRITFNWYGVSTNGTSLPLIQLGSTTYATSGYVSTSMNLQPGGAITSSTAGFVFYQNVASETTYGSIIITNVSGNIWTAQGQVGGTAGLTLVVTTSGGVTLSGTLDRIRLTTVNGTDQFDAGTINILYEG